MMTTEKSTLLLPVLLISIGTGWLLSALGVVPEINWIWTFGLAAAGLLTLVVGGIDKLTVVVGPFLMAASGLSVLRQTGHLVVDIEAPILVILVGFLMLIARMRSVPIPAWAIEPPRASTT